MQSPADVSEEPSPLEVDGWVLLEKLGEGYVDENHFPSSGPPIAHLCVPRAHSSFGKVFKARNEQTGVLAAVKIVPVEQDAGEVTREIETLKQCSSSNIVQYFGSTTKDGEL